MTTAPLEPTSVEERVVGPAAVEDKRERWIELCLVFFFSFSGSVYTAVYYLRHGPSATATPTTARVLYSTAQVAATLVLLGYVLSRTGCGLRDIGLRWSWRDVLVGVVVLLADSPGCWRLALSLAVSISRSTAVFQRFTDRVTSSVTSGGRWFPIS